MKSLTALTDPVYIPKTKYTQYDRLWLRIMNDKRDLPFIYLLTIIHLLVLPLAILLFTHIVKGWWWWAIAIPYFYIAQFYLKGRFGLMFHCLCHRKIFRSPFQKPLHIYITWFICPLFGHAPEGYFSHHMGMHHIENNMPDDTSSTMSYQRDSARGFLSYFFKFLFVGVINTIRYLFNRKRKKLYQRLTLGEYVYLAFCIAMCFVNLKATLVVFIVPLLFARLVMMLGNWTQHAFIDPDHPDNPYKSSVNTIERRFNARVFNAGFHIFHHVRKGTHYADLPAEFEQNRETYGREDAIVFDGIDLVQVWFLLITRQHRALARHFVRLPGAPARSDDEAIALFERRLQPILNWTPSRDQRGSTASASGMA